MGFSAQQRKQLSDARLARQPREKRQKVTRVPTTLIVPSTPFPLSLSTIQTSLDQSEEEESCNEAWYWDNSSEDNISDSEEGEIDNLEYSEPESERETPQQGFTLPQSSAPQHPPSIQQNPPNFSEVLKWKKGGDKHLRGLYGAGSQSAKEKQAQNSKQFQEQASKSYSLKALIENQKAVAVEQTQVEEKSINVLVPAACDPPISKRQAFKNLRIDALKSLTRLFDLVTEQEQKYGYRLKHQSDFY